MTRRLATLVALLSSVALQIATAQSPAVDRLRLDPGLDTSAAPLGQITQTLDAYLHLPEPGRSPTSLWTSVGRPRAGAYDLTARMAYQGFDAQVLEISPTYDPDSAYVVKTAYYSTDSTSPPRLIALQRLFAMPEAGRWVLSPALPRLTRGWATTNVGRLTYHYERSTAFDRRAAAHAGQFVDSLASALTLPPPPHIDYYLGHSTEEVYRILGFDYFISPSGPSTGRGGFAMAQEGVVLAGNPTLGPAYTHELVHVVLGALRGPKGRLSVMEEGTASWLGGSGGLRYSQLLGTLQAYQRDHPAVSLWDILDGHVESGWGPPETQALYATAALLVDTVYRRGGTSQLREALQLPASTSLRDTFLPTYIGVSAESADQWWRTYPFVRAQELDGRRP